MAVESTEEQTMTFRLVFFPVDLSLLARLSVSLSRPFLEILLLVYFAVEVCEMQFALKPNPLHPALQFVSLFQPFPEIHL